MDACMFVDSSTLSDLYKKISGGPLDGISPLADEYLGASVAPFVGDPSKLKLFLTFVFNSDCYL